MKRLLAPVMIISALVLVALPGAAFAHDERDATAPDHGGRVPQHRTSGPTLLDCKTDRADFDARIAGFPADLRATNVELWTRCQTEGHRHVQAAVDAVTGSASIIKILPGLYLEEPSLAEPSGQCANLPARRADLGYQVLTWEQQVACPHNQNLVAVLGKSDLQIEGTGAKPEDVVIDAQFRRLNALRADRADGVYLRNFMTQRTTFNGVYIMESDGFVIDRLVSRWNDEYGFLTFAADHGLYTDCEAYGNGDSGVYPGAAANVNERRGHVVDRYAIEIRGCYSHHNLLGYSGTAGDSVWAHDNRFTENTVGVATDSAFPNHPGLPQNHALFERNVIADNNVDYYRHVRDGTCAKPTPERGYEDGVVCPAVGVPTGTGVLNPGGNYNIWRDNHIYGHEYAGFLLSWVPGFVRNDTGLAAQFDTSHQNRFFGNRLGISPTGEARPNRLDVWWDGQGRANCWQATARAEPLAPPACDGSGFAVLPTARLVGEPGKVLKLYMCNGFDLGEARIPDNCDWFGARGLARVEVQVATAEAVLLGLVALALWWRRLRRGYAAAVATTAAVVGGVVGVLGTAYEGGPLTGIGLALLAVWWVTAGLLLRRRGHPALGVFTAALGAVALVNAVDRTFWMVPWLPVPPSVLRILFELVWVPWVLVTLVRRPPGPAPSMPPSAAATTEEAAEEEAPVQRATSR
jgi:hypothetical protein